MAEKPIIFSTPMVQAILEGRKTQTRRVIKPQPTLNFAGRWVWPLPKSKIHKGCCTKVYTASREWWEYLLPEQFPYQPGDLLWVRETWLKADDGYHYKADIKAPKACGYKWRPSIHMPKEAARIWLEVTNVKNEWLQDITEEDAKAEGVPSHDDYPIYRCFCSTCEGYGLIGAVGDNLGFMEIECINCNTHRKRFLNYWDFLYAKNGLGREINPRMWVIEFKMVEICQ